MKKKILAMILAIATISALTSCGGKDSIVGVWENVGGDDGFESIELYEDGTAITSRGDGKYETTEKTISFINIPLAGSVVKLDYELNGDSLTLTWDDGDVMEFTRVDE